MRQKIVIRVDLPEGKAWTKALRLAAGFPGVESVSVERQLNQLIIIGDGVDPVKLMVLLRKKLSFTELVSVSAFGEKHSKMQSLKDANALKPISSGVDEATHFRDDDGKKVIEVPMSDDCSIITNISAVHAREDNEMRVIEPLMSDDCSIHNISVIHGREEDEKRVIELLKSDDCSICNFSVIRVVGTSGIGKTTFVSLLYNNSTVCKTFERRAWVSVNGRLDIQGLLKEVLESLTAISCDLTELTEIQEALRDELTGKRFLIVLDDVCDEQLNFWSSLLVPMSVGVGGSIVLATSRNKIDAVTIDVIHSYELNPLSEENCWYIFRQCICGMENHSICDELKEIGLKIIGMCKGLPLAVKAIGGLLQSELTENSWNVILKSDLWYTEHNMPALRLSYDHLPVNLKRCIHYCSLFPKGYIFEKENLGRLWMSQGFIEHEEGKSERGTCSKYFNELLKRSFFQYSPLWGPTEKKFLMHDLVNDLAHTSPENKCFRAETYNLHSIPEDVHHVAVVPDRSDTVVQFEPFKEPRDIYTFLLVNRSVMKSDAGVFHVKNPAILDDLLFQLRCLRTLDLSFTNIEVVPGSIAYLRELRFLALNKTNIRRLPSSTYGLHNLQSLELQGCSYLSELPAGIEELANLQHLDVQKASGFVSMPRGIGKLTALQTLSTFTVGRSWQHCELRELRYLKNLTGTLFVGGIWNVTNSEEAKEVKLEMKRCIQRLTLQWFNCSKDLKGHQNAEIAFKILQNLQPHVMLEELTIRDYSGNRFPDWISNPSYFKLRSITLENCYECNILPSLGQLPSLKYLSIRMMDSLQRVNCEFCGSITQGGFPALETMKLMEMLNFELWFEVSNKDFPLFRSLTISRCDQLRALPCFTHLKELLLHFCVELPDLTLPELESLKIEGVQNLKTIRPQLSLPALRILEISNCNQLVSLGGPHGFTSLEQLKIDRCPKLNILPYERLLSKLHMVEIGRGCALLRDWYPYDFVELISYRQVKRKFARLQ